MLLNVGTIKIIVEFLDFHYLLSKTQAWPNSEMTFRLCLKILYPVIPSTCIKPTPAAERTRQLLHLPWIYIHVRRPGFPGSSSVKNLSANAEDAVQSLGWEDPRRQKWQHTPVFLLGKFHEQRSLVRSVYGVARVGHNWARTHLCLHRPNREGLHSTERGYVHDDQPSCMLDPPRSSKNSKAPTVSRSTTCNLWV